MNHFTNLSFQRLVLNVTGILLGLMALAQAGGTYDIAPNPYGRGSVVHSPQNLPQTQYQRRALPDPGVDYKNALNTNPYFDEVTSPAVGREWQISAFGGVNAGQNFNGTSAGNPDLTLTTQQGGIGAVGGVKFGRDFYDYAIELGPDAQLVPALEAEVFYAGGNYQADTEVGSGSTDMTIFNGGINALLRGRFGSVVAPYIGTGIGGAYVEMRNMALPGSIRQGGSDGVFTFQAIGGCDFYIDEGWSLFVEYKFLGLVGPQMGVNQFDVLGNQIAVGGLRFHFD